MNWVSFDVKKAVSSLVVGVVRSFGEVAIHRNYLTVTGALYVVETVQSVTRLE